MKSFLSTTRRMLALLIPTILVPAVTNAERIFSESFETFDANGDPLGWTTAGHPSYLRCRNESEGDWTSPYGEWAMQTYSSGVGTRTVGVVPTGPDESGNYTLKFNVSSFAAIGEYRAELWVDDWLNGLTLLAFTEGDTDSSKDFSFADEISWRYNYEDWLEGGYSTVEGAPVLIKLMQDPNRSNWRHTPIWDNVTVDFIPDNDTSPPTLVEMVDDRNGSDVAPETVVTYTVRFNEAMDPATVEVADFGNQGGAPIVVDAVTATDDPTTFLVELRATGEGTLRLRINSGSDLRDTAGYAMDTTTQVLQASTTLTVTAANPILLGSDIVDDRQGQPVAPQTVVTYTITFSKDMVAQSVSATDLDNAGTAPVLIGAPAETTPNSGIFTIPVTPTGGGTLQLMIKQDATLLSEDGGSLNTDFSIEDDTTILVDAVVPTLEVPEFDDDAFVDDTDGGPVEVGTFVIYDVFFSEPMDMATVDASDFGNAGDAAISISSVSEASPGVIRLELTPNSPGTLQLQINAGSELHDKAGNAFVTTTASLDGDILAIQGSSSDPFQTWSGGLAFEGDDNEDGVADGVAWLLGTSAPGVSALERLPTTSMNGGQLVLSFRCLKTADRGTASLKVQYSIDLGQSAGNGWSDHEAEVPDEDSTVNGIVFDTTDEGDVIHVLATIPAQAGSTVFARLVGDMP